MEPKLVFAIVAITAALAFYTSGVFFERKAGELDLRSLALFWAGLVFDTTGTTLMTSIARSGGGAGGQFGAHAVTGALAIVLMAAHACWAAYVHFKGGERSKEAFHKFSTAVWTLWLVPYVMGMLIGIPTIGMRPVCAAGTSVVVAAVVAIAMAACDLRRGRSVDHVRAR